MKFFHLQVQRCDQGLASQHLLFEIGRAVRWEKFFNVTYVDHVKMHAAWLRATNFYREQQLVFAKKAVDAWTLVGKRNHVVKDIRLIISRMVWEARLETDYNYSDESKSKGSCIVN